MAELEQTQKGGGKHGDDRTGVVAAGRLSFVEFGNCGGGER